MRREVLRQAAPMVLLCASIIGCVGSDGLDLPTGTVAGQVTLDGQPIQGATVVFFAENVGETAVGPVADDGTYTLKYGDGFSVPAGDYRVAVTVGPPPGAPGPDPMALMENPQELTTTSAVPGKYRDPQTSGLIAVVKPGSNTDVNFDLKK